MQRVQLKVTPQGNTEVVSVEGFGSSCVDATSSMQRRLGIDVKGSQELTADFTKPLEETVEVSATTS